MVTRGWTPSIAVLFFARLARPVKLYNTLYRYKNVTNKEVRLFRAGRRFLVLGGFLEMFVQKLLITLFRSRGTDIAAGDANTVTPSIAHKVSLCFLTSFLWLVGRTTDAFQPRQVVDGSGN